MSIRPTLAVLAAIALAGCGSRCPEITAAKRAHFPDLFAELGLDAVPMLGWPRNQL